MVSGDADVSLCWLEPDHLEPVRVPDPVPALFAYRVEGRGACVYQVSAEDVLAYGREPR
jgi:hypothetical protein